MGAERCRTVRGYSPQRRPAMEPGGGQLAAGGTAPWARGQVVSYARSRAWWLVGTLWLALTAGAQGTPTAAAHISEAAAAHQWNQQFAWLLREGQQPHLPTATAEAAHGAENNQHRRLQSESFTPSVRYCAARPLCARGG